MKSENSGASLDDNELSQYIQAFTASSDRVRHLILISVVASILVFSAFWNSREKNWWMGRTKPIRIAIRNELWREDTGERLRKCERLTDPCKEVKKVAGQLKDKRHSKESLMAMMDELEKTRVGEIQRVNVPFLGIHFDVNDLGAFSAFALAILSFTLAFSMARQQENLHLCLWKIRRIAERENRPNDGQSKANFLYHALSMAQVFSRPPTLARWNPSKLASKSARVLFFIPLAAQGFVWKYDLKTFDQALGMSTTAAWGTMGSQTFFLLLIAACSSVSCFYSLAGDKRWKKTFFQINPALARVKQPSRLEWLKLMEAPEWRLALDKGGTLYFGSFPSSARSLKVTNVWKRQIDGGRNTPLTQVTEINEILSSLGKVKDSSDATYRFRRSTEIPEARILCQTTKEGATKVFAGGKRGRIDGIGLEAGFSRIGTILRSPFPDSLLFVVDGPCVREVRSNGEVRTLGGDQSLADQERTSHPRILGLTADEDAKCLFIADFDSRCIRKIDSNGTLHEKPEWKSKGCWAPAAIAIDSVGSQRKLYVLELRPVSVPGLIWSWLSCRAQILCIENGRAKVIEEWSNIESDPGSD